MQSKYLFIMKKINNSTIIVNHFLLFSFENFKCSKTDQPEIQVAQKGTNWVKAQSWPIKGVKFWNLLRKIPALKNFFIFLFFFAMIYMQLRLLR